MKAIAFLVIAASLALPILAQDPAPPAADSHAKSDFDDTTQFIFYAVLEGLYRDGISNNDVDQILMKKEKQSYFHFIYACPICTSTIWALEAYRSRPESLYSLKSGASTFGKGLSPEVHNQLYSENPHQRLTAINALVKTWMQRRMEQMNLSKAARKDLLESLEKKRKEGMEALNAFKHHEHGKDAGPEVMAPAYVDLDECAVCNGAIGKVMKLPEPKRK